MPHNNSGSISKNDRKQQPKHPDYRGSANIDGLEYWISGWVKDGQNGKFLSLAFQLKEKAPETTGATSKEEDIF